MQKPPKTRFERSKKLLGLAGSLAAQELGYRFSRAKEKATRLKTQVDQAKIVAQSLGQLKGAAMKLGQLLSIEGADLLPPEVLEVLSQLQDQSQTMDFNVVQEILRSELPKEQFARLKNISPTPLASASIGQVHAATLLSDTGEEDIVLKVQFPGIAESVDSDLSLLKTITKGLLTFSQKETNLDPLFEELGIVLKSEANYRNELALLEEYRAHLMSSRNGNSHGALLNTSSYVIPKTYPELTTERVLTLSHEQGLKFKAWLNQKPSADERRHFGALILDLYFHEFYGWGLVQTDPNYANYLFRPQSDIPAQLVLLDFGATKKYDPAFRKEYIKLLIHTRNKQKDLALEQAIAMGLFDARESKEVRDLFFRFLEESLSPFEPRVQPFDFNDLEFAKRIREFGLNLTRQTKYTPPPRTLLFLHRKLGGIFHLLKALNVKMDLTHYWDAVEENKYEHS